MTNLDRKISPLIREKNFIYEIKEFQNSFDKPDDILQCSGIYLLYFKVVPSYRTIKNCNSNILQYLYKNASLLQEVSEKDTLKHHNIVGNKTLVNTGLSISQRLSASGSEIYTFIDCSKQLIFRFDKYSSSNNSGSLIIYYNLEMPPDLEEIFKLSILPVTTKGKFSILIKDYETRFMEYDIELPENLDVNLNYGRGFELHHKEILNKLSDLSSAGLYIFHGCSGTGKSTYIKNLSLITGRRFLFIPEFMAGFISSPEFISLLMEEKNSVLVIEDAEKIIVNREDNSASMASVILNLTDGILSDILKIPIIVTYNTSSDNIDPALFRKGRLKYIHEFTKLSIEDSKRVFESIGVDFNVKEQMTIADIYNSAEENGFKKKQKEGVGF